MKRRTLLAAAAGAPLAAAANEKLEIGMHQATLWKCESSILEDFEDAAPVRLFSGRNKTEDDRLLLGFRQEGFAPSAGELPANLVSAEGFPHEGGQYI